MDWLPYVPSFILLGLLVFLRRALIVPWICHGPERAIFIPLWALMLGTVFGPLFYAFGPIKHGEMFDYVAGAVAVVGIFLVLLVGGYDMSQDDVTDVFRDRRDPSSGGPYTDEPWA
jgi:hypothetical protein